MTPRELGPYLLLRKLSEDALSEIYRAGQKSGEDVERVVLLCCFKAKREDAAWLAETATVGRRALQGLSSPFLADFVDSGEEAGSAYLSYEYVSGVGLTELLERAGREGASVPLEVALHIVDRAAAGLLAAWEHESRMLHGFLVPQLVWLSNEGAVRLLGIEVASRLRRLLTEPELEAEARSYLAPEVVPESQAATTDDVYSLGALLYTLTTGEPLPRDTDDPLALVEEATRPDGRELPNEIRHLLRTSLAPAQKRARLPEWQGEIHQLVLSETYDATSFNLAVYLHQLFGERLEGAASDAEVAHTATTDTTSTEPPDEEPARVAAPAVEAPALEPYEEPQPMVAESAVDDELAAQGEAEDRSSRRFLVAAAVIALLAAGGAAFYLTRPDAPAVEQAAATPPVELPPAPAELPAGMTEETLGADPVEPAVPEESVPTPAEEELDQRVQELVAKQSKEIEGTLRDQYEREIAALRAQLAAARTEPPTADAAGSETPPTEPTATRGTTGDRAQTEPSRAEQLAATRAAEGDTVETSPAETTSAGTPTGTADSATQDTVTEVESASRAGTEPDAPQRVDAGPGSSGTEAIEAERQVERPRQGGSEEAEPTAGDSSRPSASATDPTHPPSETSAATSETTAAGDTAQEASNRPPREPPVRLGQLVTAGPEVVSPEIEKSVQPVYPIMARRLGRTATIDLRVLIDENGDVVEVEQLGAEAGFGFDAAAKDAARRMKWKPATKNGVRVKIWWPVRIAFQP